MYGVIVLFVHWWDIYIIFTNKLLLQIKIQTRNFIFIVLIKLFRVNLILHILHKYCFQSELSGIIIFKKICSKSRKVMEKLGKTVLAFVLWNFLKEIFCPCNFLVSRVYEPQQCCNQ